MKIAIASDHAGIELRKEIISYIEGKGHEVLDLGTNRDKANYANEGIKVGETIYSQNAERGVVICGTGIGITIAANKVRSIRAGVCHTAELAEISRMHNDLNVLGLGARLITFEETKPIIDKFLETPFEGGRHIDRVFTISDYEESCFDC